VKRKEVCVTSFKITTVPVITRPASLTRGTRMSGNCGGLIMKQSFSECLSISVNNNNCKSLFISLKVR
jgi:hypothetical protein